MSRGAYTPLVSVATLFEGVDRHAQEQRDAQTALAMMDHADIRGLVTAFHLSGRGAACTLATEIILAMLTNPARGFPSSGLRIALLLRL